MFHYWAGHTHSAWMNFSIICMEDAKMIVETEILHMADMHTQCGKMENLGVAVGKFDCHAERWERKCLISGLSIYQMETK